MPLPVWAAGARAWPARAGPGRRRGQPPGMGGLEGRGSCGALPSITSKEAHPLL